MNSILDTSYILKESFISMLFNSLFSFGFTYAFFQHSASIMKHDLIIDALPQTFAVTFFGMLIPTLITRKRLRTGLLTTLDIKPTILPYNVLLRAIFCGVLIAVMGLVGHYIVFNYFNIESIPFITALVYKTLYGALLSLIVTPFALRIALRELLR